MKTQNSKAGNLSSPLFKSCRSIVNATICASIEIQYAPILESSRTRCAYRAVVLCLPGTREPVEDHFFVQGTAKMATPFISRTRESAACEMAVGPPQNASKQTHARLLRRRRRRSLVVYILCSPYIATSSFSGEIRRKGNFKCTPGALATPHREPSTLFASNDVGQSSPRRRHHHRWTCRHF